MKVAKLFFIFDILIIISILQTRIIRGKSGVPKYCKGDVGDGCELEQQLELMVDRPMKIKNRKKGRKVKIALLSLLTISLCILAALGGGYAFHKYKKHKHQDSPFDDLIVKMKDLKKKMDNISKGSRSSVDLSSGSSKISVKPRLFSE